MTGLVTILAFVFICIENSELNGVENIQSGIKSLRVSEFIHVTTEVVARSDELTGWLDSILRRKLSNDFKFLFRIENLVQHAPTCMSIR